MNEDPLPHLRDLLLRRDLSSEEERRVADWLARHPEDAADWRTDLALARSLRQLRPVPVPSNFTALVLAEVRREVHQEPHPATNWKTWLRARWIPAAAGLAVTLIATIVTWQIRESRQREEAAYAQQVSALRALANLSPSTLEDFDAIQRFEGPSSAVDFELLAALQQ